MKGKEVFVHNSKLPFAEARKSTGSARHFKPHLHQRLSIGAIDTGEVIYTVAGQKARLGPGALALINPDTLHCCNPIGNQARSYLMLYLDVSWCMQVQKTLFASNDFIPLSEIILVHERLFRHYRQVMDDLLAGMTAEQELRRLVRSIFLRACTPAETEPVRNLSIAGIQRELSADLHRPLPLETLARRHGINPHTLLRQFKKATGITPHAFRLNRQIGRARELLRSGMDPATVAAECGFYDQSHLHRHFRAMTAATPGEYRRNFQSSTG